MQHPSVQNLYEFVKGHYYCDDECTEKWEPFEHWDADAIEDQIDTDVKSLQSFLMHHYQWKEEGA